MIQESEVKDKKPNPFLNNKNEKPNPFLNKEKEDLGKENGAQSVAAPVAPIVSDLLQEPSNGLEAQSEEQPIVSPEELLKPPKPSQKPTKKEVESYLESITKSKVPSEMELQQFYKEEGSPFLSPELLEEKRIQIQESDSKVIRGKSYTREDDLKAMESELQKTLEKHDSEQMDRPLWAGDDWFEERADEVAEIAEARKEIERAKNNNEDIIAFALGNKYLKGEEEISKTEALQYIGSNEYTDKAEEGLANNLKIEGDEALLFLQENQKAAAERDWLNRTLSKAAATTNSFLTSIEQKKAEALTAILPESMSANAAIWLNSSGMPNPSSLVAYEKAKKESKEKDVDLEDAFLMNYHKELSAINDNIRGVQFYKTENAIDRLAKGDLSGAAKDISEMAIESAPYTAVAMIPYVGAPLIFTNVQTESYYDYREAGRGKLESTLFSSAKGLVETGGEYLSAKAMKGSLGAANKAVKQTSLRLGLSAEMTKKLRGKVAEVLITEPSTEFFQETFGNAIDQWATSGKIDWTESYEAGALGALSGMQTASVMSSPSNAVTLYSGVKKQAQLRKLNEELQDAIFNYGNIESKSDREKLKSTIDEVSKEYLSVMGKSVWLDERATPEQRNELKEITFAEKKNADAQKMAGITTSTLEVLEERSKELASRRKAILEEIESVEEVVSEKPSEETEEAKETKIEKRKREISKLNQEMLLNAANDLGDSESKEFRFSNLEDIPTRLRDRARKQQRTGKAIDVGTGFVGKVNQLLGRGKEVEVNLGDPYYTVEITGKELRDLASEKETKTIDDELVVGDEVELSVEPKKEELSKEATITESGVPKAPKKQASVENVTAEKQGETSQKTPKSEGLNFLDSAIKGSDTALDWIAQQKKDLDKFGKETLGMNLPVLVAKAALEAAEVTIKSGKTVAVAVRDAKKAVVNSEWYKGLNDDKKMQAKNAVNEMFGRKTTRTINQETQGLTPTERFKQGFSEYVSALKEKEKSKRIALQNKAKVNLDVAKKALRERAKLAKTNLDEARKQVSKDIDELLKDKNISSVSSVVLKRIKSQANNVNTKNLDKVVKNIEQILDYEVYKSRILSLPNLITKAKKVISKGRVTMYQERLSSILSIDSEMIPDNPKGNALLTKLEELYKDIVNDKSLSPDEAIKRGDDLFQEYLSVAETNQEAVNIYWANYDASKKKGVIINELLDAEKITVSQAQKLKVMTLQQPKKSDGEMTEQESQKRFLLIESISKNLVNINPRRRAELTQKHGEGFKQPINIMAETLIFKDDRQTKPFLDQLSTKALEQLHRALAVSIPANDLTSLDIALSEIIALKNKPIASKAIKKGFARVSFTDVYGLISFFKDFNFGKARERRVKRLPTSKIDVAFGDFSGLKPIFKTFLEAMSVGNSNLESQRDELLSISADTRQSIIDRKSTEASMADMRMFYFQSLKLFESNPNTKGVFHPQDTYEANVNELLGGKESGGYANMYKLHNEFSSRYAVDGVLDFEKIEKDLTKEEVKYLKEYAEEVSPTVENLARTSKSAMRGGEFMALNNHVSHMNALKSDVSSGAEAINAQVDAALNGSDENVSLFSTKAGTTQTREATKATPVVPSIFKAHRAAIDAVLLDYNMTVPVKATRKLLRLLESEYKETKDEKALQNLKIIKEIVTNSMYDHLVHSADMRGDFEGSKVFKHLVKAGYYHQLGDPIRAGAELLSNSMYIALSDPASTKAGLKYTINPTMSKESKQERLYHMARVLSILPANQAPRVLGSEVASIRLEAGLTSSESQAKWLRTVQGISEAFLSKPDAFTAQAIFFGKFARDYKKATGREFNLETFTKEDYELHKSASDKATSEANFALEDAVSSNNPYTGSLASRKRQTDAWWQTFDKYLSRFPRNERAIAEESIGIVLHEAKKGKGADKKRIRASMANLAAATARYFSYQTGLAKLTSASIAGVSMASAGLWNLLGMSDGEDDEEKELTYEEQVEEMSMIGATLEMFTEKDKKKKDLLFYKINREMGSFVTSMTFAGVGNIQKQFYAMGINILDVYHGEGLTRPETSEKEKKDYEKKKKKEWSPTESYDEFKSMGYSNIRQRHLEGSPILAKDMTFLTGSMNPFIKATNGLWEGVMKYNKYDDIYEDEEQSLKTRAEAKYRRDKYQNRVLLRFLPQMIGAGVGDAAITRTITRLSSKEIYKDPEEEAKEMKEFIKEFKKELIKQRKANN